MGTNYSRAHKVPDGLIFEDGVHLISGSASPYGIINAINPSRYLQNNGLVWAHPGTGGVNAWTLDIDLNSVGKILNMVDSTTPQGAATVHNITELIRKKIQYPEFQTTSLNGTLSLAENNNSLQIISGTATGYSAKFPEATTLANGRKFFIANQSTQSITIKDFGSNSLVVLIAGGYLEATLQDNTTSNGIWIVTTVSTVASGIQSFSVVGSASFSTTSTTDVMITGMSATPVSGTYAVFFNTDIGITSNNNTAYATIYKDSTAITDSVRSALSTASSWAGILATMTVVSFNGSESCNTRIKTSGSSINSTNRTMLLIRLGN